MSLLIGDKLVVSMHYKLTDNDDNIIDSSEGSDPLSYLHGAGNIIPGLEKALIGKTEGDSLQVKVDPAEGYGEYSDELLHKVDREMFQGVDDIQPGMAFDAQGPEGQVIRVVIKEVEGDEIIIDGNHPLAGKELNFDVEIVEVREATEEEIAHGHVH